MAADQRADAERMLGDLAASGFPTTTRWAATDSACRDALLEEWDLALTLSPLPNAAAPLREEWQSLPIVLVAEEVTPEVLEDSHGLGALVCRTEGCRVQLGSVLGRIARGVAARHRGRAQRSFERAQTGILERVARGAPLEALLEQIVRTIERHMEGACSILLLDRENGRVRHGAAPSLPRAFVRAIDGAPIGPSAGSCGTAMYRGERVVVRDIATHPYWADYKDLALSNGLASCWSTPILSPSREVLGSFAVYYREPRDPDEDELRMVDTATYLAAIAILRERTESALRESEARYRQLIDTTHEGVIVIGFDARVSFANPRAASIAGYGVDDLVGRHVKELLDPSEVHRIASILWGTRDGGQQFELHMRTRLGEDVWVILAASPILDSANQMVGMLGMLTDITERIRAEDLVRRSEERLRAIFEGACVGMALVDADTRPVQTNPALERFLERDGEELRDTTLLALIHPRDLSEISALLRRLDSGDLANFTMEARFVKKSGEEGWSRLTLSRIDGVGEAPANAVFMIEDLGESKRLEAAIHAEERLRAMIYESVSDVVYYIGVEPEGRFRFLSVNPAFCIATGLSESEIVGRPVEDVIPAESLPKVLANYRRAIALRRTIRWDETSFYPSGTKYGEVSVTPVFDASGACTNLVGTVHDITERVQAEATIAEQAALLDRSRDAIVVHGLDGRVRFWNEGARRLYGYTRDEAISAPIMELLYRDPEPYRKALSRLLVDGSWTGQLTHHGKRGQELVIESSWTLLRDPEGHAEGVLAIYTDVTEKAKLKDQIVLAQRMESLGTLAGGIAHDFNNVLTAIVGHLDLAMRELPRDHAAYKRLEVVDRATDRAADLVNQILTFSRKREAKRVAIPLAPVVREALRLLRATLPRMIAIEERLPAEEFPVLADASQIHQIVMNLGTNAAHAMGSHGTLAVSLEPVVVEPDAQAPRPALPPGRYMRLTVSDDGCGMDAATLERIYDPFFTTKPPGEGTGLGLSVVHGIVEDHGGVIDVTSRPGAGTTFVIHLPAAAAEAAEPAPLPPLETLRGNGQRILCVDDEHAIVDLVCEVLEGLGYQAIGFTDARQARRAFEADPEGFGAIVTDFAMPKMTGTELASAARALRSDIPVVLTSGYLRAAEAEDAKRVGVDEIVSKPHFVEPLARALFRVFKS